VAIWGPLSIQLAPSWIWGSPAAGVDASGWALAGNVGVYFQGKALQGFWLKGHVGYESFTATVTHPILSSVTGTGDVSSMIVGGTIGNTQIFGRDGGFSISGGIGIGAALADPVSIIAVSNDPRVASAEFVFYDAAGKIQILGTFGLGVTF
jgi:hypothetical protein